MEVIFLLSHQSNNKSQIKDFQMRKARRFLFNKIAIFFIEINLLPQVYRLS